MKSFPTQLVRLLLAVLLLGSLAACDDAPDEADGGVLLVVEFTDAPARVGVNDQDVVTLETLDIDSVTVNPEAGTSDLMDVLLDTMEVTYTRADTGTRTPVPYVIELLGTVPVGGTLTYSGIPVLSRDQMRSPPLSDLLFENGGVDSETGKSSIRLNVQVRVFGRTVGGSEVASAPRAQTIEFVPSLLVSN